MARVRVNWNLIIVLILAVIVVAVSGVLLRKYNRKQRSEVRLAEGLIAYEDGRWAEAATHLGQYLSIHRNDVDILIKYAQSQIQIQPFKRENLAQAINAYRIVLRLEDNELAANEIIKLYLRFGMPTEAELIARRFVEKSGKTEFHQSLGLSLIRQRKYEEAVDILMELVHQDPKQVNVYKLLAEIAEKRPEMEEIQAGEWFDKAVEKNPNSAQAYILRSTYRLQQGQLQASLEDIEKAEQCNFSDIETYLSLAVAWIQQGQYLRAQEHLEQVKAMDPASEELWYIWGAMASEMGDKQRIAAIADEGLQTLGEGNYNFLMLAAEMFVQAGQIERSRKCIAKLNDVEAERKIILYLEGLVAHAMTDWATAIQKWQRAIQLGFSSETVYLYLTDTLDQINNRPVAIQLLRNHISQFGGSAKEHLQLAKFFAKDYRWQDALEHAMAAVQAGSTNLEARVMFLRCQIEILDKDQEVDAAALKDAIGNLISQNDALPCQMLMYHLAIRQENYAWAEKILTEIEEKLGMREQIILPRARVLMRQGKVATGILELENAVTTYPDSSEIIKLLAWGYSRNKEFERCRTLLETAYRKSNDPFNQRKYRLWLVEMLRLEGKQEEGIEIYHQMAEENRSDVFVRRQLLAIEYKKATEEQLQQWIDEIKAAEGENGWQWKFEQARFWCRTDEIFRRQYEQIIRLLNENLSFNADDQASRILLASCHERAGNVQLALSLYQDMITKGITNLDFVVAAVGAMYRAEEYRQAQEILKRVSESGVWDPRLAKYDFQNSLRTGQESNALTILEKMVARSPNDNDAKLSLALLQIRSKKFGEAENNIREVLAAQPDSIAATATMAELYIKQNNPREALSLCDAYLSEHESLQAYTMRCQILLTMKDAAGVAEGIAVIESKYGEDKKALQVVSRLYQSIGKIDKSMEVLDRLLIQSGEDYAVQKQAALLFLSQKDVQRQNKGKELLEKALEQEPKDVNLRLRKAMVLIQKKTGPACEQAHLLLNQLIKEHPKLEPAWRALVQLSLLEKKPAQAMDYALRGLFYFPKSRSLLLLKAQAESARSPMSAVDSLKLLLKENPQDIAVILMLSQNYRKAGQIQEAFELMEEMMSKEAIKDSLDLQNEFMAVLYKSGQKERAREIYQNLIEKTNDGRILIRWLGLLSQEKLLDDIRMTYQAWAQMHPDQIESVLDSLMTIILEIDPSDKNNVAEDIVKTVLINDPENEAGCNAMAILLHQTGRKTESISWYEKVIQLNPKRVVAMNNLAWILCTEKSEYQRALEIAQKGLSISPSYVDLIDTRGVIYMRLGQYEEAIDDFEQCKKMYFDTNPNKTATIFRLGKCLLQAKKDQEALIELFKAKDLNVASGGLTTEQLGELESIIVSLTQKTLR